MKYGLSVILFLIAYQSCFGQNQGGIGFGIIKTIFPDNTDVRNAPLYYDGLGSEVTVLYKIKLNEYKKLAFDFSTIFREYTDRSYYIGYASATKYDLQVNLAYLACRPMMEFSIKPNSVLHLGLGVQGAWLIGKCIKGSSVSTGQLQNIRDYNDCNASHDHKVDFRICSKLSYDIKFNPKHTVFLSILPSIGLIEERSIDLQFQLGWLLNHE